MIARIELSEGSVPPVGRFLDGPPAPNGFSVAEAGPSIREQFEKRVMAHPDREAVIDGTDILTYQQVKACSDRIADTLLDLLGPEPAPVAILYGVESAVVPAVFGVLAAGKFYVPLDPSAPPARLRQLMEDTGCRVLLTRGETLAGVEVLAGEAIRILDTDRLPESRREPGARPEIGPGSIAYVMHTSGSTGRPKGVIQTHANILFDMWRQGRDLKTHAGDRYGLLFSAASSASGCSLFGPLLNGAAVVCYDIRRRGIGPMAAWFEQYGITICDISVATLRLFAATLTGVERFPRMRLISPGGEPLYRTDIDLCRRIFTPDCVIQNSLGTTETRTATQYFIGPETPVGDAMVPVGYPVDGKRVRLVDGDGTEAEEGEIVIRSRYLSPGYWGQPDRTSAVFIPVPGSGGEVDYRTGDLGRRLPDGRLIHLGRRDYQVKINGYRVEIAEVENVLLRTEGIEDAAVVARRGPDGSLRLVAFIVVRAGVAVTADGLHSACASVLPGYSVPSEFLQRAALPKTDNGKLDRRVLTESGQGTPVPSRRPLPARDAIEQALCGIWRRLLGRSEVGIDDDFFVLGGDSVLAMSCLLEIENHFGQRLEPSAFVPTATVARMADLLRDGGGVGAVLRIVPLKLIPAGGQPIFLIPSIFGSLLHYRELIQFGDFDRPVFGLLGPASGDGSGQVRGLADLAAGFVASLRAFQPVGPYALAGHSFGGMLALEIARQLEALGERVSFLGLLDTDLALHSSVRFRPWATITAFVMNLPGWLLDPDRKGMFRCQWATLRHRISTRHGSPAEKSFEFRELPPELRELALRNIEMLSGHEPQPIRGPVVLFGAQVRPLFRPWAADRAWRACLPGGVRYVEVPGNHMSVLTDPGHAAELARVVCEALRSAG